MVVLVLDEARSLLAEVNGRINYFRLFRRALVLANKDIGTKGGIFGVLIDTNSKISDLTPPVSIDPSSRSPAGELASFSPFVLTHTVDANWREYCWEVEAKSADHGGEEVQEVANQEERDIIDDTSVYKAVVIGDENESWSALTRMGRPMWWSTFTTKGGLQTPSATDAVNLAAHKLMVGLAPGLNTYNESTMFGVASMLCCLGVRPYWKSALASRAVANFMAILAYVNYENGGYLSSYASDPVLALGAMKVWYALENALVDYILPQLNKLIVDEVLDTGGGGEMVARILLLLAMDKCAMGGYTIPQRELKGQFVSVDAFLKSLGVVK